MARRRLSRIRDTSRKVISSQAGRKRLEGSWDRGRKIRVRDIRSIGRRLDGNRYGIADARLVTLPRCPECLFSVVLYAPIKLHAQRVLASNVIGTLVTGGEEKKYRREKKRQREGKKKRGRVVRGKKFGDLHCRSVYSTNPNRIYLLAFSRIPY